jgi:hypothetical protein
MRLLSAIGNVLSDGDSLKTNAGHGVLPQSSGVFREIQAELRLLPASHAFSSPWPGKSTSKRFC